MHLPKRLLAGLLGELFFSWGSRDQSSENASRTQGAKSLATSSDVQFLNGLPDLINIFPFVGETAAAVWASAEVHLAGVIAEEAEKWVLRIERTRKKDHRARLAEELAQRKNDDFKETREAVVRRVNRALPGPDNNDEG